MRLLSGCLPLQAMPEKKLLRFAATQIPPFHIWKTENNVTWTEGLNTFLFTMMYKTLEKRFRLSIVLAAEPQMGAQIGPGNWTGTVGLLTRNEGDIYPGFYIVLPELYEHVGFTTSFDGASFTVLSGSPKKTNKDPASIFSSVPNELWLLLGICWILVALLYVWMTRMEIRLKAISTLDNISIVESVLTFYGLLFQRGFDNLPKTLCRRLLASGWLILVIVLMTEMAGSFSSKLAVQDVPERIDRIQDILKYPDMQANVPIGTAVDVYLEKAAELELQAVWQQVLKYKGLREWYNFHDTSLLDDISSGDAVAVGFSNALLDRIVGQSCRHKRRFFYKAKETFLSTTYALMVRKDLDPEVIEIMNRISTHFGGMGFHHVIRKALAEYSDPCYAQDQSRLSYAPFASRDFIQLIAILGYGLLTSCACLLFELLAFNTVRNRETRISSFFK